MNWFAGSQFIVRETGFSAAPLLLAGFGELAAQRAGVINVGIEGTMLTGAFAGFCAAVVTGNAWTALPAALAAGLLMGAIFAVVTIWWRADQIVAGTAINILAAGATTTGWAALQPYLAAGHHAPDLFDPLDLPGLHSIPLLGGLFQQYALFYIVVLLGAVLIALMRWSRAGLIIRALGDSPDACQAAGISVRRCRTACVLIAGACAGAAGAYLSTMRGHSFQLNMTAGRGFLVLALVIFGRWNVLGFTAGTLCFGALDALQTCLAASPGATARIPHQLFDMLPYLATLAALAFLSRSSQGPICLAKPWPPDR